MDLTTSVQASFARSRICRITETSHDHGRFPMLPSLTASIVDSQMSRLLKRAITFNEPISYRLSAVALGKTKHQAVDFTIPDNRIQFLV